MHVQHNISHYIECKKHNHSSKHSTCIDRDGKESPVLLIPAPVIRPTPRSPPSQYDACDGNRGGEVNVIDEE